MEQARRTLHLITRSFGAAAIIAVLVLTAVDLGEATDPDLASGAALAAAIFGTAGLLVALRWWNRSGETARPPSNLMLAFISRVAIAELGLLIGFLGLLMTGSATAPYIGLGLFLVALILLDLGLRRVP